MVKPILQRRELEFIVVKQLIQGLTAGTMVGFEPRALAQTSVLTWLHASLRRCGWGVGTALALSSDLWPPACSRGVVLLFTSQGARTTIGSSGEGAHLDSGNLSPGRSTPGQGRVAQVDPESDVWCCCQGKPKYWTDSKGCPRTVMSLRPPWNRWSGS